MVTRQDGKSRMDMLDWKAESFSRPVLKTTDGRESSIENPSSRPRLNPAFTFWLMGLPWWWGNPDRISFAQQEMELYRSKLQQRLSVLCGGSDSALK